MSNGFWIWSMFFDPYDSSSDDEKYLTPDNLSEISQLRSDRAARLVTTATLYLNSHSESPQHWG